ncbi:hypothetical protein FAM09_09600 [Niastella caeni]|uniref:Uncharacterized protein n=1 Tax=Niastella caeni TaxID=2569763 RepID=A0A4S8HZ65_9BACT|nr:hypothetical protein [Niastella caeni]THU40129.1 hypothetical protein FAM09_09600 [Niastella caeni]
MARVNSILKISGKVDDKVHVNSKHGELLRNAPQKGSKKKEPALKQQYKRTGMLNNLAADLNRIIGAYSGTLKPSTFYQALQKRFRKEPLNNRFLLLKQLEGMEVNSTYPLNKLGRANATVNAVKKEIIVRLDVNLRPSQYCGNYKINCYAYEVSLLCWNKSEGFATHARQYSEWIYLKEGLPEFEFLFARPAGTVHWLLCLKQQLGRNEKAIESFRAEGMQIVAAGSFDKKDMAILTKRKEEEKAQAEKERGKNGSEQIKRVKAKKVK